jgi:hypothetical protein
MFSVKNGKSSSETLALLALSYGEYAMKELFLDGTACSRVSEKMCKMTHEVGSQKPNGQNTNLGAFISKIRCGTKSRRLEM